MTKLIKAHNAALNTTKKQIEDEILYVNNAISDAIAHRQTRVSFGYGEHQKILSKPTIKLLKKAGYTVVIDHDDLPLLADICPDGRTNSQEISWKENYDSLSTFSIIRIAKKYMYKIQSQKI